MAFLLTHFWPGGTGEQYRTVLAAVHPPDGRPAGQTYHAAGPTEGGYLTAAVWDSKESADCFVRDVLVARMPVAGGFDGHPVERTADVSDLLTR